MPAIALRSRRGELRSSIVLALLALSTGIRAVAAPLHSWIVASKPFIAEGVASTRDGRVLVSGVAGRTIVEVERDRVRPWLRPGWFAPIGGLFGMAADPRRNRLWVTEAFGSVAPGQTGPVRSGLLEVELGSGRVLARHRLPPDGRARSLGDVTVTADGSVYASDSTSGGIFRLAHGAGALALFAQTGLKSPQGLVPSRDGRALLLLDYASGLYHLDLGTRDANRLDGEGAGLRGLDALLRSGTDLIATSNGRSPNRVLRLRLSPDERAVRAVDILAEDPTLDDLSLGCMIRGRLVFVAHSQWSAVGKGGAMEVRPAAATLSAIEADQL
jgi:hypothetical protein